METLDRAIAKRIILAARTNVCHYYRGGPLIRTASRENECQRREARAWWNNRAGTPRAMGPIGPTRPWWEKECKWNRRCEIFRVPLMRLDEFEHENTYIITHGSESTVHDLRGVSKLQSPISRCKLQNCKLYSLLFITKGSKHFYN